MEPRTRTGDWIQTYTGKAFWPLDPRPEDVDIEDIAHALSMQCRFGGHCREFYSVAQHSVMVSWFVPPEDRLWGLLHDAAEAYLVDLPRPIKRTPAFEAYRETEKRVQVAIAAHFGLDLRIPESVLAADDVLLATEARDIMAPHPMPWVPLPEPLEKRIEPWIQSVAKEMFLVAFAGLWAEKR